MSNRFDVIVIGGGIVGLATALQTVRRYPSLRLIVLEKENALAAHQTGRNSGVIHSGIYYKPGSLKARLCVAGAAAMFDFCRDHGIPHDRRGKLVVATSQAELSALEELYRRGNENRVPGLRRLSHDELRAMEPEANGIAALEVPGTGITDYRLVAEKYAELTTQLGGEIRKGAAVIAISADHGEVVVETTVGTFSARMVVNCAGLQSDRIAAMAGVKLDMQIVPFRGEYYTVQPRESLKIHRLIYPVPDPRFPFLGVHVTPKIHGGMEAGPNAVLALKREGYTRTSFNPVDIFTFATYGGFWKMAAKYWRDGMGEYYRSYNKSAFLKALQKLTPNLRMEDLKPGGAGVRAQALGRDGKLIDDFHFAHSPGMLHVCNVPSPAATASLVIAEEIVSMLEKQLDAGALKKPMVQVDVPRS